MTLRPPPPLPPISTNATKAGSADSDSLTVGQEVAGSPDLPLEPVRATPAQGVPARAQPVPETEQVPTSNVSLPSVAPSPPTRALRNAMRLHTSSTFTTPSYDARIPSRYRSSIETDPEAHSESYNVESQRLTGVHIGSMAAMLVTLIQLNPSDNPKVNVLQKAAAVICVVSLILFYFQSRHHHVTHPAIEKLYTYYPYFVLASCGVLYLVSVALPSPRAIIIPFVLVLFAVLPMLLWTRVPARFMLGVVFLFPLGLVTCLFLIFFLPSKLLS